MDSHGTPMGSVGSDLSAEGADEPARRLFQSMVADGREMASTRVVLTSLRECGLLRDDQRIGEAVRLLESCDEISFAQFFDLQRDNCLIERALTGALSVRECAAATRARARARSLRRRSRGGPRTRNLGQLYGAYRDFQ